MPATNFPEYAREIQNILGAAVTAGEVTVVRITIDQRSAVRGFIYDNAAHQPSLPQVEHKHTPATVAISPAPTLAQVIDEALMVVRP